MVFYTVIMSIVDLPSKGSPGHAPPSTKGRQVVVCLRSQVFRDRGRRSEKRAERMHKGEKKGDHFMDQIQGT